MGFISTEQTRGQEWSCTNVPQKLELLVGILVDSSIIICWTSSFVISGVSGLFCRLYSFLMENPVNIVDSDSMPHDVAPDRGLQLAYEPFMSVMVRMG